MATAPSNPPNISTSCRRAILPFVMILPLLLVGLLVRNQPSQTQPKKSNSLRQSFKVELTKKKPTGPTQTFKWDLPENTIWLARVQSIIGPETDDAPQTIQTSEYRFIIGEREDSEWLVFIEAGSGDSGLFRWRDDGWLQRNGSNQDARPWIFEVTGIWIPDTHADALQQNTPLPAPPMHRTPQLRHAIHQLQLSAASARIDELGGAFWQSNPMGVEVLQWSQDAVGGPTWNGKLTQVVRGSIQLRGGWINQGILEYRESLDLSDGAQTRARTSPVHRVEWTLSKIGRASFDSTSSPNQRLQPIPLQPSR